MVAWYDHAYSVTAGPCGKGRTGAGKRAFPADRTHAEPGRAQGRTEAGDGRTDAGKRALPVYRTHAEPGRAHKPRKGGGWPHGCGETGLPD